MRVSTASLLALPLLAAAVQQDTPLEQFKAQAQYWFDKVQSYIPNPDKAHTPPEAAAKVGGKTLNVLTLNDWKSTIQGSVKADSAAPEDWWVLVTGGNKTCFGQCEQMETAFNQTALLWSFEPTAPHLAYLNCDNQPVLCNSWGAGPPSLWIMEVSVPGAPVNAWTKNINATTASVGTFTDLLAAKEWKTKDPYTGIFHPFDGFLAQYGLAVPAGYVFWAFAVVPSWMFMIGISFLSRNIMSKRMQPPTQPRPAAPAAGARVGAPPGDGRFY